MTQEQIPGFNLHLHQFPIGSDSVLEELDSTLDPNEDLSALMLLRVNVAVDSMETAGTTEEETAAEKAATDKFFAVPDDQLPKKG